MRASSSLSRAVLFIAAAAAASALDNGVGRVPALGYSTWNRWLLGINETLVIELADALVSTGLRAAGYEYLNLDAGVWLHARDAAGNLQADPAKFPSGLPALAAAVRARGLRLGLYTDLGEGSCGPGPGSGGHWPQDARYFASLGADYIKVDFCGAPQNYDPAAELAAWRAVADAVNATGRPMYLSICPKSNLPANTSGPLATYAGQGGLYFPPQAWTAEDKRGVANAWLVEVRNNVDGWSPSSGSPCTDVGAPCGMTTNLDSQVALGRWAAETGPGGLVDADMLQACQLNGTVNRPGLTTSESRLHFYVWAALPSPLIVSADIRTLGGTPEGAACLAMLANPEVLAINQDARVAGAALLRAGADPSPPTKSDDVTFQVFGRPLAAPGTFAAVLVNRGTAAANITLDWRELALPHPAAAAHVRDAGARADVGSFVGGWTPVVPARDAIIVVVTQAV